MHPLPLYFLDHVRARCGPVPSTVPLLHNPASVTAHLRPLHRRHRVSTLRQGNSAFCSRLAFIMLAQFSAQNSVIFSPSFYMALPSTLSIRPLTFLAVPHRPPSAPHHHLRPCGLRALLCSHALDLHSSSIVHDRRSLFCPHTVVRCRGRRSTPPQLDAAMVPQQLQASRYIRRHRSHSAKSLQDTKEATQLRTARLGS